jgi:ketosteroid isomerase-like protein
VIDFIVVDSTGKVPLLAEMCLQSVPGKPTASPQINGTDGGFLMKSLLVCVLVAGTALLSSAAETPTLRADRRVEVEPQLEKVERDLNDAFKARDRNRLLGLCSEDFLFTDDEGKVSDEAHFIDDATQHIKVSSYTLRDLKVKVYGDTSIVSGRWDGRVTVGGEDMDIRSRFTDTFVRRNGRWWAVASQMALLRGDAP